MANVEIRIPHKDIEKSQEVTAVQRRAYKNAGVDMSFNDVVNLDDDFGRKERIIKVKGNKTTHCVGDVPWHENT